MTRTVDELASRWLPQGGVGEAEQRVLQSAIDRQPVARNVRGARVAAASRGEKLADAIARIGGSWSFILAFLGFLLLWAGVNVWVLAARAFDPYPFVFLNLLLSMLAAVQAPVIMMSQNRQAAHDRADAAHDYEVNLKSEIEIMALHEKMDALRHQEVVALHARVDTISQRLENLQTMIERRWPESGR